MLHGATALGRVRAFFIGFLVSMSRRIDRIFAAVVVASVFIWAYWTTFGTLVHEWIAIADYSHGFFVVPVALGFLWVKRDRFPGVSNDVSWLGFLPIALGMAVRVVGAHYYWDSLDGWSILLWIAGVVWLFAGLRVLWWSLPSIVFLWFMVPLPFRIERCLSLPLQGIATQLSCWALQAMGQPALAESHVILLGSTRLEVEQACSGLRIFMGIVALAYAYVVMVRRSWWEKLFLLVSVVPIALISNAVRIVVTGLLYQYLSSEMAKHFSHDIAGWAMIVMAAGMFSAVLWYLNRLVREVEIVDVGALLREERA
jgi:exosortase